MKQISSLFQFKFCNGIPSYLEKTQTHYLGLQKKLHDLSPPYLSTHCLLNFRYMGLLSSDNRAFTHLSLTSSCGRFLPFPGQMTPYSSMLFQTKLTKRGPLPPYLYMFSTSFTLFLWTNISIVILPFYYFT